MELELLKFKDMISNPCCWYINGNETRQFTYEGGDKLYHFSSVDSGINSHYTVNVVFFAISEEHALFVLIRMLKFALDIRTRYGERKYLEHTHEELLSRNDQRIKAIQEVLEYLNAGKGKITLAPTNQFFKVGWAYNDTIL